MGKTQGITAARPKNQKYYNIIILYIIVKNHFSGIVSLLFRDKKKDILVAWMHEPQKLERPNILEIRSIIALI